MWEIISKYRKISLPARAAFWFTIMSVLQKGIVFLVTPIYTRMLTTGEYGYISLYTSWQTIVMVLATLNLSAGGFNKGLIKYEDGRANFISSMQGLANIVTIIVFTIIILFHSVIYKLTGIDFILIIVMLFTELFNPSFEYWAAEQRFDYKYVNLCILTIISAFLCPALSIFLIVSLPQKKYAVILGNAAIQIIIGFIFWIRNYKEGKEFFNKEYWTFALKFNIPLIPHYLSNIILGQADRVMIKNYCGSSKVGIYSLAYNVALLVNIFVTAVSTVVGPWTFRKLKAEDYKSIKNTNLVVIGLFGIIVVMAVLVAPEIIGFLGPKEYMEAKWIIAPVMLSCFATLIYGLFANIEFYHEKSTFIMFATLFSAITNIVLNALLIPLYGYLVAGYTTLASYFILMIVHYCGVVRIYGIQKAKELFDFKLILLLFGFISIPSFAVMLLFDYIIIRYVIIFIIALFVYKNREHIMYLIKTIKES